MIRACDQDGGDKECMQNFGWEASSKTPTWDMCYDDL